MHSKHYFDGDVEVAGGTASRKAGKGNWVPIVEQPAYTPRRLKIVCVGAGFAGLTLAHKVKYEMKTNEFIDLTIYEKNHGTDLSPPFLLCSTNTRFQMWEGHGMKIGILV